MSLQDIAAAMERTEGRNPSAVTNAFFADGPEVFGRKLRPVSLGAWLVLERIKHPFVTAGAEEITPFDIVTALYVLSVPSSVAMAAVKAGSFEEEAWKIADDSPLSDIDGAIDALKDHIEASFATALPMRSPTGDGGQKKTAASDGGSVSSPKRARRSTGR